MSDRKGQKLYSTNMWNIKQKTQQTNKTKLIGGYQRGRGLGEGHMPKGGQIYAEGCKLDFG